MLLLLAILYFVVVLHICLVYISFLLCLHICLVIVFGFKPLLAAVYLVYMR